MSRVRSTDTKLELRVRSALHHRGLRFRVRNTILGRPDVVFGPARVLVFIDSCFWHGCSEHPRAPKSRLDYWKPKLEANIERDRRNTETLMNDGWLVIRIWEHELLDGGFERVIARIESAVRARLTRLRRGRTS